MVCFMFYNIVYDCILAIVDSEDGFDEKYEYVQHSKDILPIN